MASKPTGKPNGRPTKYEPNGIKKIEVATRSRVLEARLRRWTPGNVKNGGVEKEFCVKVNQDLPPVIEKVFGSIVRWTSEFTLKWGRVDFFCKFIDGRYGLIEVKTNKTKDKYDLNLARGVGQLLAYRTSICLETGCDPSSVVMCLVGDAESPFIMSMIDDSELPILFLVLGDGMVKAYGGGIDGSTD